MSGSNFIFLKIYIHILSVNMSHSFVILRGKLTGVSSPPFYEFYESVEVNSGLQQ